MGLVFKKDRLQKVLEGRKTQTRRTSRNTLKVGKVYLIRCRYFEKAKVLIIRKFKQRLGDISLEDVRKEGFDSLEEFQACWARIHGSWRPDIIVTVYEFKLARPEREPLEFSRRALIHGSTKLNSPGSSVRRSQRRTGEEHSKHPDQGSCKHEKSRFLSLQRQHRIFSFHLSGSSGSTTALYCRQAKKIWRNP